jgi:hypothetical protein
VPPKLTLTIGMGARSTSSLDVVLALDASDLSGVLMMRLSEDHALVGATASTFAKATMWTLSTGDGEKVVYASVADEAGNWGVIASDSIVLDTTAPFSTIVAIPPQGTSAKAAISWNATDKLSGVAKYDVEYREGKGPWIPWLEGTCSTAATFVGEYGRSYDFRARGVDALGNTEPFPVDEARFAHVVFPELPWFLVRTTYIWFIVIIVVAASVVSGYYLWRRRAAGGPGPI